MHLLVKKDEFDEVDLSKLPVDSHVRLAKEVDLPILRRSYSYSDGIDERTGQFDSGFDFHCLPEGPRPFCQNTDQSWCCRQDE